MANLHLNKYNHIRLPIKLSLILILSMNNNVKELLYQLQSGVQVCMLGFWKRVNGNDKHLVACTQMRRNTVDSRYLESKGTR